MKLYIAGQITGLDYEEAFANFERAERLLEAQGHEPINPMKSEGETPGRRWLEYLAEDLLLIDQCDGLYMQANWSRSRGARLEHFAAELEGKHIFYAGSELPESVKGESL